MPKIAINGKQLRALREQFDINVETLASELNVDTSWLQNLEESKGSINKGDLERISKYFSVNPLVFAMKERPFNAKPDIPDFRTLGNNVSPVGPSVAARIRDTKALRLTVQDVIEEEGFPWEVNVGKHNPQSVPATALAQQEAERLRYHFVSNISERRSTSLFYIIRTKIESLGIFVITKSWPLEEGRAFCLVDDDAPPFIVLNSEDKTSGARLFSLLHEYCHILLGVSALSDFINGRGDIEKYCNNFAASFLMPEKDFMAVFQSGDRVRDFDDVKYWAAKIGVSQYAFLLRCAHLKIVSRNFLNSWISSFGRADIPDSNTPQIDHALRMVGELGVSLTDFVISAARNGVMDPVEVYRHTRLKPEYFEDAQAEAQARRARAFEG